MSRRPAKHSRTAPRKTATGRAATGRPAETKTTTARHKRAFWSNPFLDSVQGKVIATVGGALAGTLAVIFIPFRDQVVNLIWPEDIQVVPSAINVIEGQPSPLTVTLLNRGKGPLKPSGVVTVSSTDGSVFFSGNPTLSFAQLDGSATLDHAPPLQLTSRTFGTQRLSVSVRTSRNNHFLGELLVNAAKPPRATTVRNIVGDYDIVLNAVPGSMTLQPIDVASTDLPATKMSRYAGNATLQNGKTFDVKVWRDGTVFHVDFFQGQTAAYSADGLYCTKTHDDAKWIVVNAKVVDYTSPTGPHGRPEETLREKCPRYPTDLVSVPGDGWFFASVALD